MTLALELLVSGNVSASIERFKWTQTVNGFDRLTVYIAKGSESNIKGDSLSYYTLQWNDNTKVDWHCCGRWFSDEQMVLEGIIASSTLLDKLNQKQKQIEVFQVPHDNDWKLFITKEVLDGVPVVCDKSKAVFQGVSSPTIFIRPPGYDRRWLLNHVLSMVRQRDPSFIFWKIVKSGNADAIKIESVDESPANTPKSWKLTQVSTLSSGETEYDLVLLKNDDGTLKTIQSCIQREGDSKGDIFPAITTYLDDGCFLYFAGLTVDVRFVNTTPVSLLKCKLRTRSLVLPSFPLPIIAKGKFVSWHDTDTTLWKVELCDPSINKSEILVYPRLQFPGKRGVYVPPKKDDPVLVTIPHGGFPFADVLTVKPDKKYDTPDISIIGEKTVLIEAKESLKVEGKTEVSGETQIKSNLKVTSKLEVGGKGK